MNKFKSKIGRHFYGHEIYSKNSHWLYVTKHGYYPLRGLIRIHDVKDSYL